MEILQIAVLSVVQGITEFLPISSSAHLILVPALTGWPDQGLAIDAAMHIGTLAAVIAYFHRDTAAMVFGGLHMLRGRIQDRRAQLALQVVLGTIPVVVVGALLLVASAVMTPLVVGVPLLAVSLFLLGLGWNVCFVAGSALVSDAVSADERGKVQGASETLVALASGAGSVGAGLLFDRWGMMALGGVSVAFCLILLGVAMIAAWPGRPALRPRETG
jgi:MFS family permease